MCNAARGSCVVLEREVVVSSEKESNESTVGDVRIKRWSAYGDKLRRYTILLDDQPRVRIKDGEELVLEVSAGMHTLQVKLDWVTSERLVVEVPPDGEISLTCGGGKFGHGLANLLSKSRSYIQLHED